MCKDVAKSGLLCGSKSITGGSGGDLFERHFYVNAGIMWRAHSGQPGVTSGTSERCGITSEGGFL